MDFLSFDRISSRKTGSKPGISIPIRSINRLEVRNRTTPVFRAHWAVMVGPVVQLRSTGTFPARKQANSTTSLPTEAGSITPMRFSGNLQISSDSAQAPIKSRWKLIIPDRSSARAGRVVCFKQECTKASGRVLPCMVAMRLEPAFCFHPKGAGLILGFGPVP